MIIVHLFHKTGFMDIFLQLIARVAATDSCTAERTQDTHNIYYLFHISSAFCSHFGYKHHYKTI